MKKQGISHALILLLLAVTLLRIPNLFEPYWYGDEGIYLTLGQAMRRGLTLYRDIHDNKPPLLYVIAAIAGTEFWFKFILIFWHLATIVIFYKLATLLFPKHPKAPIVAAVLMALLTMLPEGNIANGEIFMILPVIAGMLLLWRQRKKYFLAGILFSLGFLFKVPAAFDFAAAVTFFALFQSHTIRGVFHNIFRKEIALLSIGFIIPIVLSIVYYAANGALTPYLRSALLQNIGYLGSWSAGKQSLVATITHSGLVLRTLILGVLTIVLWITSRRFKLSKPLQFSAIWFLFALYGALLSERPYPHYLIQPAIPAVVLLTLVVYEKKKDAQLALLVLGVIGVFSYFNIGFWQYPVLSYYQNFLSWVMKQETTEQYFSYFGAGVLRTYQIAKFVKLMTGPEDRIFVWGDEPNIYALSERLPPGRYTVAYHVIDFNGYEETAAAIQSKKPTLIIILQEERRLFPQLSAKLVSEYVPVKQFSDAMVYQRMKN